MNYQLVLDETLKEIIKNETKPKLLLHVCCAPCSSYVLEYLNKFVHKKERRMEINLMN